MKIKIEDETVQIDLALQPDEWLVAVAQEIAEAAKARGIKLPTFAGGVAVEGAADTKLNPVNAKEAITGQLDTALVGYQVIATQLNADRQPEKQFEPAHEVDFVPEFEAWLSAEKVEYVAKAMEADPDLRFTLVATPNVTATADEAIKLARTFGEGQPYRAFVSEFVRNYTPEQLSGTNPANANKVQFSLVPNKFNPDLHGTVPQQREALARLQAEMPDLRVPSFLEAMTLWQTLRAQGDTLTNGYVFNRTYIRYFDLPVQRFKGRDIVLRSCVYDAGQTFVDDSDVRDEHYGRTLVG